MCQFPFQGQELAELLWTDISPALAVKDSAILPLSPGRQKHSRDMGLRLFQHLRRKQQAAEVIRQAVRKFASQFVRKRIRLVYEPTEIRVLTDEKWLSFILEQLLSNAIKYTGSGEIRITVEGKIVRISDTGIGIAPEDLPRIFERGFTGYNGRMDKKSTGIGLYLCKHACQRLSIGISADSRIGSGSVFSLDLNTDAIHPE